VQSLPRRITCGIPLHAFQLRIRITAKSIAPCRKSCVVGCEVLSGVGIKSQLKVRLMCKAYHAEERAAFRSTICSTPPTPLRYRSLRKINCTLQNALVEKGA